MNEEELRHRIKNAIILLKDGHSFKVGDLTFNCSDKKHFSVTGWSIKNDLKNITKASSLTELKEIKELFQKMTSVSSDLAEFVRKRQIEYCLGYDYGMGGLAICSEMDGKIKWVTDLKE